MNLPSKCTRQIVVARGRSRRIATHRFAGSLNLTAANSSALEICFTIFRGRRARVCRRGDDDQRSPWIDRAPSFMIFDSIRTHETYPMEL